MRFSSRRARLARSTTAARRLRRRWRRCACLHGFGAALRSRGRSARPGSDPHRAGQTPVCATPAWCGPGRPGRSGSKSAVAIAASWAAGEGADGDAEADPVERSHQDDVAVGGGVHPEADDALAASVLDRCPRRCPRPRACCRGDAGCGGRKVSLGALCSKYWCASMSAERSRAEARSAALKRKGGRWWAMRILFSRSTTVRSVLDLYDASWRAEAPPGVEQETADDQQGDGEDAPHAT